jgi:hypothetical protein
VADPVLAAVLAVQAAIALAAAEGVRRRNPSVVVNGVATLAVALTPAAAGAVLAGPPAGLVGPTLSLWVGLAGVVHLVGMLGWYERLWWWDHLAHGLSASLVGALAYAGGLVLAPDSGVLDSRTVAAVATVGVVVVAGVFWELLELAAREVGDALGVDPVLVHYGWRDTGLDLVFDVVGAVAVVAVDLRVFLPLAAAAPATTRRVALATVAALVVGSLALAAWVDPRGAAGPR